jgi:ABC-2 type transport system permease protein
LPASQYLYETYIYVKSLYRERQTLFWALIFPLVYLSIVIAVFGDSRDTGVSFSIAVQDLDRSALSRAFIDTMNRSGIYRITLYDSDVNNAVAQGRHDAGIVIPRGFMSNLTTWNQTFINVIYIKGLSSSDAARASLDQFINRFGSIYIESSIETIRGSVPEDSFRYILFMLRPINSSYEEVERGYLSTSGGLKTYYTLSTVGFMILYSGLFTSIGSIVEARRSGVLQLILSSPIRSHRIFVAKILAGLTSISITSLTIIILGIVLGADLYKIPLNIWGATVLLLILGAIGVMGIGFILAPFMRTSGAAVAVANIIAFPTMFLGGIAIPRFLIPSSIQIFADIFPLSRIVDSVRNIAVYGWEPIQAIQYSIPAIVVGIATLTVGWILYRRALEKALESP